MKFLERKKQGSASFYVVAFSTLILVIITASFISIVLSGLTRTENDELAQSAYDAALAGVEDAKVAFLNYQKCLNNNSQACRRIVNLVRNPNCYMVGRILGRIGDNDEEEVLIEETSTNNGGVGNNMQQAYTCVKFETLLSEYKFTLTEEETTKVVRVRLADGVNAERIKKVKISWGRTSNDSVFNFATYFNNNKIGFPKEKDALPPMISVGLIQTADSFNLDQFEKTDNNATNRGTVFLVPTGDSKIAMNKSNDDGYLRTCGEGDCREGKISASEIVKTNDHGAKNRPFAVYCSDDGEYVCSTTLELPGAIGGNRSNNTFSFVVSSPYGISTSFKMEFFCGDSDFCGTNNGEAAIGERTNRAKLDGVQVKVDSTGRANNLFRRVEAVLEGIDESSYPLFGLELLDDGNNSSNNLLEKPERVECEYTFSPTC